MIQLCSIYCQDLPTPAPTAGAPTAKAKVFTVLLGKSQYEAKRWRLTAQEDLESENRFEQAVWISRLFQNREQK